MLRLSGQPHQVDVMVRQSSSPMMQQTSEFANFPWDTLFQYQVHSQLSLQDFLSLPATCSSFTEEAPNCRSRDLEDVRCLLIQTCRWVMVTGKVSLMVRYRQPEALVLTCSLHFKKNRTVYEKIYIHSKKIRQCCTFV